MTTIEESIEIEVPVSTAYNQWTQFESFPTSWRASSGSSRRATRGCTGWPNRWREAGVGRRDHRTASRSPRGLEGAGPGGPNGVVTFHKLDDARTKVMVQMEYEPDGVKESIGSTPGSTVAV